MTRRRTVALLALAVVLALATLLALAWAGLPRAAERAVARMLVADEEWTGSVGRIELELRAGRAVMHDVRIEALSGRKVLKRIEIPRAEVAWSWGTLRERVVDLDVVADGAVVEIGTKEGPKPPFRVRPLPEVGPWRFRIDAVARNGTFVFRDAATGTAVRLAPVDGTIDGLGTMPGPARFRLNAHAPGGGTVRFDGLMDFWNAHRDAFDLRFDLDGLELSGFPEAARTWLGTGFESGRLDGVVGFTQDPGRRELPMDSPFHGGFTHDPQKGSVSVRVVATDVRPTDLPIDRLAAGRVVLAADGAPTGRAPFVVRGAVEGLEARVLRSWAESLAAGSPRLEAARLPPVRIEELAVDGRAVWVDDEADPPIEVAAEDLSVHLRESGEDLGFEAEARVRGAGLRANGRLRRREGPLDADLRARFHGLRADAVSRELHHYLGAVVDRGTLDATADVRWREGRVGGTVEVDVTGVLFEESGWVIAADRAVLDLLDGTGFAEGVRIDPQPDGTLQHIQADRARVTWDPQRLLEGVVVASIEAERPTVVVLERPGEGGDGAPGGGKIPWSLDLHSTDGTVVWHDPDAEPAVEIAIDRVDGRIRRLGTLYPTSLWDLVGSLPGGGRVEVTGEMDPVGRHPEEPWRLDVAVRDAQLPVLQDKVAGYLGRPIFATGTADADLSILWSSSTGEAARATGNLRLVGRDLTLLDPPVEAIALQELSLEAWWDPSSDAPYRLVGSARGVDVLAHRGGIEGGGRPLADYLAELPPFRVERFEVYGGELRFVDRQGKVPVDLVAHDLELDLYDLHNLGPRRATLVGRGRVAGGRIGARMSLAPMSTPADFHLDAELRDVPAVALNDALRALAGFDVRRGTVDVTAAVRSTDGELAGTLRADLRDVAVRIGELRRPGAFLRSVGVGVLLDVVERGRVATVRFPVSGTVAEPRIGVGKGLVDAVRRSLRIGTAAESDAVPIGADP